MAMSCLVHRVICGHVCLVLWVICGHVCLVHMVICGHVLCVPVEIHSVCSIFDAKATCRHGGSCVNHDGFPACR